MDGHRFRAVFWDFGGVITSSPFEAFNNFEVTNGLPVDLIRAVNRINPDGNAWALLERQEVSADEFDSLFAVESEQLGHRVSGSEVLAMLHGSVRLEIVTALDRVIAAGFITACLTNNFASDHVRPDVTAVLNRFDHVIESSKLGVRKPELAFYEMACNIAGVEAFECVFLDDLGINLKPARAMGMTTIKVINAAQAISDLAAVLAIDLQ